METQILRRTDTFEDLLGFLAEDLTIHRRRYGTLRVVGRVDENLRVYRASSHGEQVVGEVQPSGAIYSAGLLEGGPIGWMDPDGVVIRGGLILGEEEVGRVEGPRALAAAGALLLVLLPIEEESERRVGP